MMDLIKFENLEASKLASDTVLQPIQKAIEGSLNWQNLRPHFSVTIARYDSKVASSMDEFAVKLTLRLPDGRCFDCEKKADTLSCAADSAAGALKIFLKN